MNKPEIFILDVDGIMTNGSFSIRKGKFMKARSTMIMMDYPWLMSF